jgi:hypothetical protein
MVKKGTIREAKLQTPAGLRFGGLWLLQPVPYLIGPEALKPGERLIQFHEFIAADAADLLDGCHVLLVESGDNRVDFLSFRGEADSHRAAVDARAGMMQKASLDELLDVVGDI